MYTPVLWGSNHHLLPVGHADGCPGPKSLPAVNADEEEPPYLLLMRSWTAERGRLRLLDSDAVCCSVEEDEDEGGGRAGRELGGVTNSSMYPGSKSLWKDRD